MVYLLGALGVWNLFVFVMYGADKLFASNGSRRISEKMLLVLALLMGSPGALLGMYFFRHKTKKLSFQAWLFLILVIQVGLVYLYLWLT